ncbi:guanylin-like [Dendrobates tinctorius]|uniref:guanylin-like n=1 Tax=Dendrobates tinctorius TaxID=92724 RepID=UPI003CC931B0
MFQIMPGSAAKPRSQEISLAIKACREPGPGQNQRILNMWPRVLCLLALIHLSAGVIVKVGDLTFPLESVKKLKEVLGSRMVADDRAQGDDIPVYEKICSSHVFPELRDLCDSEQTALIAETLRGLGRVADNMDVCEVCAFAACSGC